MCNIYKAVEIRLTLLKCQLNELRLITTPQFETREQQTQQYQSSSTTVTVRIVNGD